MGEISKGGPGLTVTQFLASIADQEIRRLLDKGTLSVLDAMYGGQIVGDSLRTVARKLVDMNAFLGDKNERKHVLSLLSEPKRAELEHRVGQTVALASNWTDTELNKSRDFFGLLEEVILPPMHPAVTGVEPSYGLFEHQRTAIHRLEPLLFEDERRAVLHFPTGAGKTRTAMHIVADSLRSNEPSVVVWLASGKELLDQAVLSFKETWKHLGVRPLQLGSMWGSRTPDLETFTDGFLAVGLAKGWAVMSRTDPDWAARLAHRVRLVVFDEAHQSIARTYRRITDELTLDYRCSLLGLTATPGRTWADIDKDGELAAFFAGNKVTLEVPGDNPIGYLIENGYLAQPFFSTLMAQPGMQLSNHDLSRISQALDIPDDVVESLSMSEQYITAVLRGIEELIDEGHLRVLVFAATVRHAQILTALLAVRNVHCAVVTGSTPLRLRNRSISAFKSNSGVPMVLVNFGVLTTGFDAPKASAVVIARPTLSLVLYSQMVGRAIRGPKAGGTGTCKIITVVDPNLPAFGEVADAFLNWEDVW